MQILKDSLLEDPLQGVELSPDIRKIRMAVKSKNKGKSGGLRVITYNVIAKEQDGEIVLLVLYDKADASTAKLNVLKDIIKEMGFPMDKNSAHYGIKDNNYCRCQTIRSTSRQRPLSQLSP